MKGRVSNVMDILKRRYYQTIGRRTQLEEARANANAARLIYDLRTEAKLSQKQLAELIGTTQSVISRLEDDDYNGHSLSILNKIVVALSN